MTTQAEVRRAFWEDVGDAMLGGYAVRWRNRRQNEQPADIRCAFVDYVDSLARDGTISEALAARVTL